MKSMFTVEVGDHATTWYIESWISRVEVMLSFTSCDVYKKP